MKILKVRAKNINSLKGETEIDFEKFLKGETIFAITGPTGSGKTTILDIISCALYGRTPRLNNPKELMSRHTTQAYCEVEFEVNSRRYVSRWSIRRSRNRVNGEIQTPDMELFRDGEKIESRLKAVQKRVQEVVNLDFDRFKQSIMLAQGEFNSFLKANGTKKSELLEKITGTHIYKDISKMVRKEYEELKGKIEALEQSSEPSDITKIEALKNNKIEIQNEIELLQKDRRAINRDLNLYKILKKLIDEKKEIKRRREALESKEEIDRLESIYQSINLALTIEPTYKNLKEGDKRLSEIQTQLGHFEKELKRLIDENIHLKEKYRSLTLEFKNSEEDFNKKLNRVKEAREINSKIDGIESILDNIKESKDSKIAKRVELKSKISDYQLNLQKGEPILKELNIDIDKLNKTIGEIEHQRVNILRDRDSSDILELKSKKDELETLKSSIEEIDKLKKEIETLKKEIEFKKELLKREEALAQERRNNIKNLEDKIEQELLIKKYERDRELLEEGMECFLCGSTNHPYIKEKRVSKVDRYRVELDNLKLDLDSLQRQIDTLKSGIYQQEATLQNMIRDKNILENTIKSLSKKLNISQKERLILEIDRFRKGLNEYKELEIKYIKSTHDRDKKSERRDTLKDEIGEMRGSIEFAQNSIRDIDIELQKINSDFNIYNKELMELKDKRFKLIEEKSLDSFEKSLRDSRDKFKKDINSLKSSIDIKSLQIDSKEREIIRLQDEILKAKSTLNSYKIEFKEGLNGNFESEEEFLNWLKYRDRLSEIRGKIDNFKKNLSKIDGEIFANSKKIKETQEALKLNSYSVDALSEKVDSLTLKESTLEKRIREQEREVGALEREIESEKEKFEKYQKVAKEIRELNSEFEVLKRLDSLIGSAQGAKFPNFVQSVTLNILIDLANNYLKDLSPRYRLKSGGKELEITVIDRFQADIERPITTLSGGETFLISLSLALALSNLASKNVSIDSLFLDEGFGTLDTNSLDLALDTLSKLQNRGKIIGVISHVDSLKERIPLQIRVTPQGNGVSRVELVDSSI